MTSTSIVNAPNTISSEKPFIASAPPSSSSQANGQTSSLASTVYAGNNMTEQKASAPPSPPAPPPDGGLDAYLQVLGAHFLFFNSWSVVNPPPKQQPFQLDIQPPQTPQELTFTPYTGASLTPSASTKNTTSLPSFHPIARRPSPGLAPFKASCSSLSASSPGPSSIEGTSVN